MSPLNLPTRNLLSFNSLSLTLCSLIAFAALLNGCGAPATSIGMIPYGYDITKQHPRTVGVIVQGGSETSPIWKSQISDEEFNRALTEAISNSKVFSGVAQAMDADYLLYITIFSAEQPTFGTAFTVTLEIGWTLKRADTKVTIWQEAITSEHTVTVNEAFAGVKRLRLATEGAARKNIKEGLLKISKLDL